MQDGKQISFKGALCANLQWFILLIIGAVSLKGHGHVLFEIYLSVLMFTIFSPPRRSRRGEGGLYYIKLLIIMLHPRHRRSDLVMVFVAGPVCNVTYYLSYRHQTCMDHASGPNYGLDRLGCWIWAMNFRCWRGLRCLEQVKLLVQVPFNSVF